MSRGFAAIIKLIVGICVICVICRFLGITWADVNSFIDNGLKSAVKVFGLLKGAAHTPLN